MKTRTSIRELAMGLLLATVAASFVGCGTVTTEADDQARLAKAEKTIDRHEGRISSIGEGQRTPSGE